MKKEALLRITFLLHEEMRKLTLEAGVAEKKYDSVILGADELKMSELRQLHNWLKDVRDGAYHEAHKMKSNASDSLWEHYRLHEITDMPEQLLLNERFTELRQAWRKVPRGTKKKAKPKTASASVE